MDAGQGQRGGRGGAGWAALSAGLEGSGGRVNVCTCRKWAGKWSLEITLEAWSIVAACVKILFLVVFFCLVGFCFLATLLQIKTEYLLVKNEFLLNVRVFFFLFSSV